MTLEDRYAFGRGIGIAVGLIVAFVGCQPDDHACIHYRDWAKSKYSCHNVWLDDEHPCDCYSSSDSCMYDKDMTCEDYGFKHENGDPNFLFDDDNAFDESLFKPNLSSGQQYPGSGSSTPSTPSCGEYTDRGIDDIQVKSHCQAAWNYTCSGNTQGVSISCSNLDGLAQISTNGTNPKDLCPYCD